MTHTVLVGDSNQVLKTIAPGSVQTCITSPAYFGLRDYGHDKQMGQEDTPADYVGRLVGTLRLVRDTLADNGTLWLNLGDSYYKRKRGTKASAFVDLSLMPLNRNYKEGDLIGIPFEVALALRDDGWYWRNEIVWSKTNGMTESSHDRLVRSHEQSFLFSKNRDYFFDDFPLMEPTSDGKGMRLKRDVWTLGTANFKGAHFAVYPEKLVEPCILAGTSEHGDCRDCGKSFKRLLKRTRYATRPGLLTKVTGYYKKEGNRDPGRHLTKVEHRGWGCACKEFSGNCTQHVVLDPFLGSGTTSVVAKKLGRSSIGIEINPDNAEMARKRIEAA